MARRWPRRECAGGFLHCGLQEAVHTSLVIYFKPATTGHPPGERPDFSGTSGPHPTLLPPQGILRAGLEEVEQFFALNGSCRLPLSPSLLVKGVVPRVSDWRVWGSQSGEGSWKQGPH